MPPHGTRSTCTIVDCVSTRHAHQEQLACIERDAASLIDWQPCPDRRHVAQTSTLAHMRPFQSGIMAFTAGIVDWPTGKGECQSARLDQCCGNQHFEARPGRNQGAPSRPLPVSVSQITTLLIMCFSCGWRPPAYPSKNVHLVIVAGRPAHLILTYCAHRRSFLLLGFSVTFAIHRTISRAAATARHMRRAIYVAPPPRALTS